MATKTTEQAMAENEAVFGKPLTTPRPDLADERLEARKQLNRDIAAYMQKNNIPPLSGQESQQAPSSSDRVNTLSAPSYKPSKETSDHQAKRERLTSYATAVTSQNRFGNKIRRDRLDTGFTFEYKHGTERTFLTLFVNPEDFSQTEPARITITQTKGGAFVDHFGQGLKQISMKGVTGYRYRDVGGTPVSGHDHFLAFRSMIRTWEDMAKLEGPDKHKMFFYNWADNEFYEIAVTNFTLQRSNSRPLLYQYTLTFTCLKKIGDESDKIEDKLHWSLFLTDFSQRAPKIIGALDDELNKIDGIVNGTDDMTKYTKGTQDMAKKIRGGETYFDTILGMKKPIRDITYQVRDVNEKLKEYVYGVSNFVNQPFIFVKDLATSIGDVLKTVGSVANIPHEMMRSWREMICAISALPEAIFKGYTNPNLFDGTSNCGSSLGIEESPLRNYDNSFTATAQLPSERTSAQQFIAPQSDLVLRELPTKITGVYLATDTSRTGTNYLQSYTSNKVTLTSVPNSPVVVDYMVRQSSEVDMLRLQQARSMIVKTDHTMTRISEEAYGDASQWKMLALFNELEYPFIVPTGTQTGFKATGSVVFQRDTAYTHAIAIPEGFPVFTLPYRGTNRIDFRTTETKVLNLNVNSISVAIEALLVGDTGNVSTGVITGQGVTYSTDTVTVNAVLKHFIDPEGGFTTDKGFYVGNKIITTGFSSVGNNGTWTIVARTDYFIQVAEAGMVNESTGAAVLFRMVGLASVTNPSATIGGKTLKVLMPGDIIQIPDTVGTTENVVVNAQSYEELFGIDIYIDPNTGEFGMSNETQIDMQLVVGTKNLIQAIRDRIVTSKGYYPYYSNYGSDLPYYVGKKNITYWQNLAAAEAKNSCLLDPRISSIKDFRFVADGDIMSIELDAIPINEQSSLKLNMIV